ncbi:MAG: hypothetical protein R6V08_01685 [Desulfuromonadales bacterium]
MKTLFSFLFMILVAVPASAMSYETLSVNNGTARIQDRENSRVLNVQEGDSLEDGWSVAIINKNRVIIEKWINEDERIRGVLPARLTKVKKQ